MYLGPHTHNKFFSSWVYVYCTLLLLLLLPLMIVLICTLKFGLNDHIISRTSLQILLNFIVSFVSLSRSFADVHRTGLVHVGITLEFLLNSAKLDMRKNGLEIGIATPSQKLSSFHSRKNCECFCCTPITIPTMYNNYCRQYLLGLFWFHLHVSFHVYKSYHLLFYSSLL